MKGKILEKAKSVFGPYQGYSDLKCIITLRIKWNLTKSEVVLKISISEFVLFFMEFVLGVSSVQKMRHN